MGVKLKDIAEQCGTSVATVSYVLSGKGVESRISSCLLYTSPSPRDA